MGASGSAHLHVEAKGYHQLPLQAPPLTFLSQGLSLNLDLTDLVRLGS